MRARMRVSKALLRVAFALALLASMAGAPVHAAGPPEEGSRGFLGGEVEDGGGAEVAAPQPIAGFTDTVAFSGVTGPVAVRFSPDGRVVVAERRGRVFVYPSLGAAPTMALDIRTNVNSYWDRGLLGLALDPNFASNNRIYVLYTYDHILGDAAPAPRWSDVCPSPPGGNTDGCVVSGRVSRFTLTNNVAGAEQVLVEAWCQQFVSHSIGDLGFGSDGFLYASAGEGAGLGSNDYGQFGGSLPDTPTPANPCGDPPNGFGVANTSPSGRGGSLRSQSLRRPAGEPVLLNGTVIRIDPATGAAAAGNPLAGHASANARRIVAYGLRNPYRFAIRPGTSEVWIGDVGSNRRDEINRLTAPASNPVENFGWPCYEGTAQRSGFNVLNQCINLYADGSSAVNSPYFSYQHGVEIIPGEGCPTANGSVISGLAFYNGGNYPARFTNALFFTDYLRKCIWAMRTTNGLPDPTKLEVIVRDASNPVDLEIGPNGDLFYADFAGAIRRIRYTAGNAAPSAAMTATPSTGLAPMTVAFDARLSADSNPGDTLSYAWDFTNNGSTDATGPTASFQYVTPAIYTAKLTVTDQLGAASSTTQQIVADGSAPIPEIDSPSSSLTWKVGDDIAFSGSATDGEGTPLPASALTWTLTILHCTAPNSCHPHAVETREGVASGTFDAPDHSWPSSLIVELTATADGLESDATVRIEPKAVTLGFSTTPTGLALTINGTPKSGTLAAPTIPATFIVGSAFQVVASTQVLNGLRRTFSRWSDGSTSASRTLVAPATPWATPLGATFVTTSADLSVQQTGALTSSGGGIKWRVTARNAAGALSASSVRVKVDLPGKLGPPVVLEAAGWSCRYKPAKHRLVCDRSSLAGGASSLITFRTPIERFGAQAKNVASISSATLDVATGNNTVSTVVILP